MNNGLPSAAPPAGGTLLGGFGVPSYVLACLGPGGCRLSVISHYASVVDVGGFLGMDGGGNWLLVVGEMVVVVLCWNWSEG